MKRLFPDAKVVIGDLPACAWTDATLLNLGFKISNTKYLNQLFHDIPNPPALSNLQLSLLAEWDSVSSSWGSDSIKTTSGETRKFWKTLIDVRNRPGQEALVNDFVVELFRLVFEQCNSNNNQRQRVVHSHPQWKLYMANAFHQTIPDIVVEDEERDVVILLQEDKSRDNNTDFPYAQAVAGAVAYYQNLQQRRLLELDRPLAEFPILLAVCHGLRFSFLRLTLNIEMLNCVGKGVRCVNGVTINRCWNTSSRQGFSFDNKEEFTQIMQGLAYCWYIAEHLPAEVVIPAEEYPDLEVEIV